MGRISKYGVLALIASLVALPRAASGQGYLRSTEPAYFLSGAFGMFTAEAVNDGASHSRWDFGNRTSWQYRAAIEKAIQNQSSIGIVATHVTLPFTYSAVTTPGTALAGSGATCTQCGAHLDMESLAATFHAGGGLGFHQVLDASVGATKYRNLRRDSDNAALAPKDGSVDGSFLFGYGFGYGLSSSVSVNLVQEYGIVLHEGTNLPNGTSNTNTIRSTRIGLRFGFGTRSAVRGR